MQSRERRNRLKLLVAAVVLSGVIVVAALQQRDHQRVDPFTPQAARPAAAPAATADRPVFGARPSPIEEAPPQAAAEGQRTRADEDSRDIPGDVLGFLERWRTTLLKGDIDAHTSLYALKVDKFFRQRNVSRASVKREKERFLRTYPSVNKYDIRDVKLESMSGDRAVVTFRKDWDTSGRSRRFAGSEVQRLTLRRAGPAWQIVGEEELKVYWTKRA
jgi:hypothetical protein